jgi:hypothetical protein
VECMWVTEACGTGSQRSEWGRTESDRALEPRSNKRENDNRKRVSSVSCFVLMVVGIVVLELTLSLCFVMSLVVSLSLSHLQSLKESAWCYVM